MCGAREQFCFLTTPEHQRTFRGKYMVSAQASGTLVLDGDELLFRTGGWVLCLPFWRIGSVALGRLPWMARPVGRRYIEVEHTTDEGEAAVWLTPTYRCGLLPWLTDRVVTRWYVWLSEALRKHRERA
jgi:hypothetical protein